MSDRSRQWRVGQRVWRCSGPTGGFSPFHRPHLLVGIAAVPLTAPPGSPTLYWPWSRAVPAQVATAAPEGAGGRVISDHGPDLSRRRRAVPGRDPPVAGGQPARRAGARPGFSMTKDEKKAFNEEWTKKLFDGGWICASWPKEYGGKGLSPHGVGGAQRGVRPGRGAVAGRLLRRHPGRADHPAVGHRGAEAAVHPRHPQRHHRLVPGLLASPTPAATWPRSRPGPSSTATSG